MSENATAPVPTPAISARPAEPLRRRILRALLYGKADRSMKARGRIGLAMLAFTSIYAIIAGRLVVYALTPDSHGGRRIGTDAVATARPDVLDRRGDLGDGRRKFLGRRCHFLRGHSHGLCALGDLLDRGRGLRGGCRDLRGACRDLINRSRDFVDGGCGFLRR